MTRTIRYAYIDADNPKVEDLVWKERPATPMDDIRYSYRIRSRSDDQSIGIGNYDVFTNEGWVDVDEVNSRLSGEGDPIEVVDVGNEGENE